MVTFIGISTLIGPHWLLSIPGLMLLAIFNEVTGPKIGAENRLVERRIQSLSSMTKQTETIAGKEVHRTYREVLNLFKRT